MKAHVDPERGGRNDSWLPGKTTAPPPKPDSKLLEEMESYLRCYVVLPEHAYLPVSLWMLATHAVEHFDCFPYIAAVSAVKRSGKTRLAEVLELVVRDPWRGTAPSPAALYRMLNGAPTLLLDEVEMFNGKNKSEPTQIILAVLNAGHRKGATIPRCDGPRHELQHFPVYGPKFFAAIGHLPETLLDRSIVVPMKRRTRTQPVKRFRQARAAAETATIRDRAIQFVEAHAGEIERAYQAVLDADLTFLNDRDADIWTPLFTLLAVTVPERRAELEESAGLLSAAKNQDDQDESWALSLLRDIRQVWPLGEDKLETAVLIERLKALEESPWAEQELTPRKLARTLKPFEVYPRTIRVDARTPKGYYYDHFKDAFDRYLPDLSATATQGP